MVVKRDPKTGLNYLSIKGNEAQGVSVIITSDKDIETLNKLADEFQKYPVSSQRFTAGLYALLEISGNLKCEKDGFTFLTPNGITYIPYDGDSSKAWEIDMPGSCYATARKCLAAENDCADISAWTKNLKGIKIYYGDNYGTTQTNNVYKVDDLGRYFLAEIILVISSVASSTLRELSAIRISDTLSSTLLRPAIVIVSGTLTTLPVVR